MLSCSEWWSIYVRIVNWWGGDMGIQLLPVQAQHTSKF